MPLKSFQAILKTSEERVAVIKPVERAVREIKGFFF